MHVLYNSRGGLKVVKEKFRGQKYSFIQLGVVESKSQTNNYSN